MIIQGTPDILYGPRGLNGFGSFGEAITPEIAMSLMYRSSTGGGATIAEFDMYGGYAAVSRAATAAGYDATPEWIQSYEISRNLPESSYTKLNKQFFGEAGRAKLAQLVADVQSKDSALVAATEAKIKAIKEAADAEFLREKAAIKEAAPQVLRAQLMKLNDDIHRLTAINKELDAKALYLSTQANLKFTDSDFSAVSGFTANQIFEWKNNKSTQVDEIKKTSTSAQDAYTKIVNAGYDTVIAKNETGFDPVEAARQEAARLKAIADANEAKQEAARKEEARLKAIADANAARQEEARLKAIAAANALLVKLNDDINRLTANGKELDAKALYLSTQANWKFTDADFAAVNGFTANQIFEWKNNKSTQIEEIKKTSTSAQDAYTKIVNAGYNTVIAKNETGFDPVEAARQEEARLKAIADANALLVKLNDDIKRLTANGKELDAKALYLLTQANWKFTDADFSAVSGFTANQIFEWKNSKSTQIEEIKKTSTTKEEVFKKLVDIGYDSKVVTKETGYVPIAPVIKSTLPGNVDSVIPTSTINPALILAAVAAYFFIGG